MAIIIDGYNVLHTSRWLSSSWKGADRQRLCRLLGELAKYRAEKITVVFDALPAEPDLGRAEPPPLKVIFSGHGRTADEVIIQMINKSTGPRDLTVVSSDRQIRAAAKRRGCKIRQAGEFIRIAAGELAQENIIREPAEKQKGLSQSQTKQWLAEFGLNPDEKEDPYEKMYR